MNFHILTLFPEMVMHGLSESILGRAADAGLVSIEAVNIRDYAENKHKKVDDYPYGGGAGMLMQAQPVYDAWKTVVEKMERNTFQMSAKENLFLPQYRKEKFERIGESDIRNREEKKEMDAEHACVERESAKIQGNRRIRTVYLTPQGAALTQSMAEEFAKEEDLILLCGHYEGIDERVLEEIVTDYVSIGDYVLTGGELAAMVLVDAVARLVPGVLNNEVSAETESFHNDLLEYPQYSRPAEWHGKKVPPVLMSGNQKKIRAWRLAESEKKTKERRPDLYEKYQALQDCKKTLLKKKLLHIDMIDLISRGQAELIFEQGNNICLKDKQTGIYFHTTDNKEIGCQMLEVIKKELQEGYHDCSKLQTSRKVALHYVQEHGWKEDEGKWKSICKSRKNIIVNLKKERMKKNSVLVWHQDFMTESVKEFSGAKDVQTYRHAVYTKKEKVPITGLYRQVAPEKYKDGKKGKLSITELCCINPNGILLNGQQEKKLREDNFTKDFGISATISNRVPQENFACAEHAEKTDHAEKNEIRMEIRKLGMEHFETILRDFSLEDLQKDVIFSIKKGRMFGAFADEKIVGIIGIHPDGSIGMLEVLPEWRGRKIGKALETYVINDLLELGQIPYGKIKGENTAAEQMQEALGLYLSKEMVYQMVWYR